MKIKNIKKTLRKCSIISTVSVSILAIVIGITLSFPSVFADTEPIVNDAYSESVMAKVRANAILYCLSSTYFKSGPFLARDFKDLDTISTGKMDDDGTVRLPYLYGNSINDADLSCEQLIKGYHKNGQSFTGLAELGFGGIPNKGDLSAIDTFLQAVGYDVTETYEEGEVYSCYQLGYKVPKQNGVTITEWIRPLCWRTKDGKITAKGSKPNNQDDAIYITDGKNATSMYPDALSFDASGNTVKVYFDSTKLVTSQYDPDEACSHGSREGQGYSFKVNVGDDWNDVMDKFDEITLDDFTQNNNGSIFRFTWIRFAHDNEYCSLEMDGYGAHYDADAQQVVRVDITEIVHDEPRYWTRPIGDSVAVKEYNYSTGKGVKALNYFTGLTEFPTYTQSDRYWMYYRYFVEPRYFDALSINGECATSKPSGSYLQYYDSGKKETTYCPLDESILEKARNKNVMSGVDNSSSYKGKIFGISKPINVSGSTFTYDIAALSVDDVLGELDAINLSSYCGTNPDYPLCKATPVDCMTDPTLPGCEEIVPPSPGPTEPEEDTVTDEDLCYRNAKSLGWIICPVMFGAREMADSIYDAALPLIQTNESIVSQLGSNASGLYKAWEIFRNLANILFVVLFMFIIFSQLTGYGIDNYGIKRMLPKVIVTVILINLSYIICALAVDAANIVGSAVKGLFESIANNVGNAVVTGTFGEAFGQVTQAVIGGLAIGAGGAMIAGITIAMEGWAIVIPILIFFLTVLISVLFAFIVLGMRQALVVILIVISPLAFACNMLPNTESLYKKWYETAKKILMVYPIIGAVTGVSYLTARILLSADSGFFMTLVAGILMVGPYFYIPQLVSEALDSVKSLGARIGNIGNRMRTNTRNRINGSERVKDFVGDGRADAAARRGRRFLNSKAGRAIEQDLRDGKEVSNFRARRYMRAQERANGDSKAVLGAYESLLNSGDTANRLSRMRGKGFEAREAGLQDKAFEDAVSDQMALMEKDGTFASDSDFENAVFDAATKGDQAKLEALMRKAAKGSDNQRARLFKGMSNAFKTGSVDKSIAGRYGAHLTSNPIYKSNDPSAYGLGTALTNAVGNGTYGTTFERDGKTVDHTVSSFTQENYTGKRMLDGKVASVSAFNFDDAEFDALAGNMGNFNDSQKQDLANIMQGAVDAYNNDPTGQFKSVKPETIDKIKNIITATGMTPGATTGATLTVDHSSSSADRNALDAYTESVIKRVLDTKNGGITAEEGEAMIRKAEEYYKKKHGGK